MYEIYSDDILIYKDSSPQERIKLIDPQLTIKENTSGTLTLTVPPINNGYSIIEKMRSTFYVYRDGKEFWRGRMINESVDYWNRRKMTCEGALSFLNDIILKPQKIHGRTTEVLPAILTMYNDLVGGARKVYSGSVTLDNYVDIVLTEYTTVYDVLKEYFIERFDGYFKMSFANGDVFLDFIEEGDTVKQQIIFGTNLIDFTKDIDMTDVPTVIIPLGPQDEDGNHMTIEDVSDDGIYYINRSRVDKYGRIEKVVNFEDAESPEDLLSYAEAYAMGINYDELTLELNAVDMTYLGLADDHFELLDNVRCISRPHALDETLVISEISISFDKPENTKFVLGRKKDRSITGRVDAKIEKTVKDSVPSEVANQISKIDWPEISRDIIEGDVINAETMVATFCYAKYMLVQFLETNFDAIDASGDNPTRSNSHRNYIRIYNEKIYFFEDELTDTKTQYEFPAGKPLYWTAIDGDNAYKYFTYETPLSIAANKRPSGISDDEFKAMYAVKVWATAENGHHEKGYIGFSETSAQTMEPMLKLGVGDGTGYGIATIQKGVDGLDIRYSSRTLKKALGIKIKDDGFYGVLGDIERRAILPLLYGSLNEAQNDVGKIPAYTAAALITPEYRENGG